MASIQHFVGLAGGEALRAGAIVRLVPSIRWDAEKVGVINVTPFDFKTRTQDVIEKDPEPHGAEISATDSPSTFKLHLQLGSCFGSKYVNLTPSQKCQDLWVHDVHWKPDGLHHGLVGPTLARPVLLSRDPATSRALCIREKTRNPVATSGRLGIKCACGDVRLPRATVHVSEKDVIFSYLVEAE